MYVICDDLDFIMQFIRARPNKLIESVPGSVQANPPVVMSRRANHSTSVFTNMTTVRQLSQLFRYEPRSQLIRA